MNKIDQNIKLTLRKIECLENIKNAISGDLRVIDEVDGDSRFRHYQLDKADLEMRLFNTEVEISSAETFYEALLNDQANQERQLKIKLTHYDKTKKQLFDTVKALESKFTEDEKRQTKGLIKLLKGSFSDVNGKISTYEALQKICNPYLKQQ